MPQRKWGKLSSSWFYGLTSLCFAATQLFSISYLIIMSTCPVPWQCNIRKRHTRNLPMEFSLSAWWNLIWWCDLRFRSGPPQGQVGERDVSFGFLVPWENKHEAWTSAPLPKNKSLFSVSFLRVLCAILLTLPTRLGSLRTYIFWHNFLVLWVIEWTPGGCAKGGRIHPT